MTISNTFQENSSTVLFYSAFSIWKILHMCIFNSDQLLLENVVTANGVKMPLVLNKTHCWCTRIDKYSKWLRSNLMSWKGLNLSFWRIRGASLHFWRLLFCILMENLGGYTVVQTYSADLPMYSRIGQPLKGQFLQTLHHKVREPFFNSV